MRDALPMESRGINKAVSISRALMVRLFALAERLKQWYSPKRLLFFRGNAVENEGQLAGLVSN
jgi:hypothetical protein